MGWRFRKSIRLGKYARINLNKKSTSVTFGTKGYHKTYSSTGRRTTSYSIPGTGLSYVETDSKSSSRSTPPKSSPAVSSTPPGIWKTVGVTLAVSFFAVIGFIACNSPSSSSGMPSYPESEINRELSVSELQISWDHTTIKIEKSKKVYVTLSIEGADTELSEIPPEEFSTYNSDNDVCNIEYGTCAENGIRFYIEPLSNGQAEITARYKGVSTETLTVKVDIPNETKETTDSQPAATTVKENTSTAKAVTDAPAGEDAAIIAAATTTTTTTTATTTTETTTTRTTTTEQSQYHFILNTSTKKAHTENCSSVANMSAKNKSESSKSPQQLEASGYSPCQNCRPW